MKNQKLYKVRQILKLTQSEMASKLGITTRQYNILENGKSEMSGKTYDTLLKLLCKHNVIQIKKLKDF